MPRKAPLSVAPTEAEIPMRNRSYATDDTPVTARPLTLRQVQVLKCVEQFIDVHGFPPSLRDLCLMLDMSSLAAIVEHLNALVRKGYLARDAGERRGLRVLRPSAGAPVAEPRPLRKAPLCAHCKARRTA